MPELSCIWRSDHFKYHVKLIGGLIWKLWARAASSIRLSLFARTEWEARLTREEGFTISVIFNMFFHHPQEFSKNTADCPHVNGSAVLFIEKNDFGSSVPARHNVLC